MPSATAAPNQNGALARISRRLSAGHHEFVAGAGSVVAVATVLPGPIMHAEHAGHGTWAVRRGPQWGDRGHKRYRLAVTAHRPVPPEHVLAAFGVDAAEAEPLPGGS